jgi:hypothetical protein
MEVGGHMSTLEEIQQQFIDAGLEPPTGIVESQEMQLIRKLVALLEASITPALTLIPNKYKTDIQTAYNELKELIDGD